MRWHLHLRSVAALPAGSRRFPGTRGHFFASSMLGQFENGGISHRPSLVGFANASFHGGAKVARVRSGTFSNGQNLYRCGYVPVRTASKAGGHDTEHSQFILVSTGLRGRRFGSTSGWGSPEQKPFHRARTSACSTTEPFQTARGLERPAKEHNARTDQCTCVQRLLFIPSTFNSRPSTHRADVARYGRNFFDCGFRCGET